MSAAPLRCAFLGTPEPAVPALRALAAAEDLAVEVVITNPDRPRDRGHRQTAPPVKQAALDLDLPVWQPTKPRQVRDDLAALDLDVAAVVAYGAILPADVLATTRHGFVNLHFSLLPAWRGAAPVPHALLAGDTEIGVTCFRLDPGMDSGDVLLTAREPIHHDDTAGTVTQRLAERGAPVLVDALRGLVRGTLTPQPQDHEQATLAPKIEPDDAQLDWQQPAARVERAVRAFNPWPGAHTTLGERRVKVHAAEVVHAGEVAGDAASGLAAAAATAEPGAVVGADDAGPLVVCGDGALLRLREVQPAGKARMDGRAFVNGYQPQGQRLGASAGS